MTSNRDAVGGGGAEKGEREEKVVFFSLFHLFHPGFASCRRLPSYP